MYPKSKSPLETKYERLRGMCSGAWGNVRYIPIDNGIQAAWQDMAVYGWCRVYIGAGQHSRKEGGILVYDMRTQYTPAITRASQRPGACIACVRACVRACVILLYYYIIIIL